MNKNLESKSLKIDFTTATPEALNNLGITSLDFLALCGHDVQAVSIGTAQGNCGPAKQDGVVFELTGAEVRYATLTNGDTVWSDDIPLLDTGDSADEDEDI